MIVIPFSSSTLYGSLKNVVAMFRAASKLSLKIPDLKAIIGVAFILSIEWVNG